MPADIVERLYATVFANRDLAASATYTPPGGGPDDEIVVRAIIMASHGDEISGLTSDSALLSDGIEIDVRGAVVENSGHIRIADQTYRVVGEPYSDRRNGVFRCRCV